MTVAQERRQKSTTVRADNKMRLVRTGFGLAERFAPRLGGRLATRLWCTLPRGASGRRDDRPGRPSRLTRSVTTDGRQVVVETWGEASAAPVYLAHGWGGWRGQLGAFVAPLLAAGHRVVAFDAPSHGESAPGMLGPGRATAQELADALTAAVADHGAPAGVVAHSLGGLTTVLAMADGLDVPRLVLVAPAADPFGRLADFAAALGFGPRVSAALTARLERYVGRPMADYSIADLVPRTTCPPCLFVHDAADRETPVADARRLAAGWPGSTLVVTEGLGHRRILADAGVVARVTDYLA